MCTLTPNHQNLLQGGQFSADNIALSQLLKAAFLLLNDI